MAAYCLTEPSSGSDASVSQSSSLAGCPVVVSPSLNTRSQLSFVNIIVARVVIVFFSPSELEQ